MVWFRASAAARRMFVTRALVWAEAGLESGVTEMMATSPALFGMGVPHGRDVRSLLQFRDCFRGEGGSVGAGRGRR